MAKYQPRKIESKWQKYWETKKIYQAKDFDKKREKYYALVEFPYPSGDGLHVGHVRSYTALDIIARKRRMEGRNVLYPIGWDAFGLPTENYAVKTGIHPAIVTKKNTDTFRKQLKSLGFSFDWSREVNTSDPDYYKWTQWLFLKFFKHNLAYKTTMPINWCPSCKIGLANEETVSGRCERCGTVIEKRNKEQWMLGITKYADKLIDGLRDVAFLPEIKIQQKNWIGRSPGALIKFDLIIPGQPQKHFVEVFTTRPDTIDGVTFVAVSPLIVHKLIDAGWKMAGEVKKYIEKTITRSGEETQTEKTGVFTGILAINPFNLEKIPVWVVNYVLADVGTGAVMGVPGRDERDFEFAQKFNLASPKKPLVDGVLVLQKTGGKKTVIYKLHDWVFSRQRYWGEPIPIVYCPKCGYVAVPEKDLPVKLPNIKDFKPRDDGQSPLASVTDWVNTKCPKCKGAAKRETDVMPNWAGSSWYFLRYTDPRNRKEFASRKKLDYYTPVDWYNGGMEHVTLHLLYSRFWNLFFHEIGLVPAKEPYRKRTSQGLILGEGGTKMSKSKGNVINPDDVVKEYGADTLRMYEMFIGPFDQAIAWNPKNINGVYRFLSRVWNFAAETTFAAKTRNETAAKIVNGAVKNIENDIENTKFNTAVSGLMKCLSSLEDIRANGVDISRNNFEDFMKILAPFAPHISEEIWMTVLKHKKSVHLEKWPSYDPTLIIESPIFLPIQVNGRVRDVMAILKNDSEESIKTRALAGDKIKTHMGRNKIVKIVYVPGKIINIVTE